MPQAAARARSDSDEDRSSVTPSILEGLAGGLHGAQSKPVESSASVSSAHAPAGSADALVLSLLQQQEGVVVDPADTNGEGASGAAGALQDAVGTVREAAGAVRDVGDGDVATSSGEEASTSGAAGSPTHASHTTRTSSATSATQRASADSLERGAQVRTTSTSSDSSRTQPAGGGAQDLRALTGLVADVARPVLAPVADLTGPVLDPVVDTVRPVLDDVAGVAQPLLDPVAELTRPLLGPVADAVQPVLSPVGDAAEPVLEPVTRLVDPVLRPVTQLVEPVATPVGELTQPVTSASGLSLTPVSGGGGTSSSRPSATFDTQVGVSNGPLLDAQVQGLAADASLVNATSPSSQIGAADASRAAGLDGLTLGGAALYQKLAQGMLSATNGDGLRATTSDAAVERSLSTDAGDGGPMRIPGPTPLDPGTTAPSGQGGGSAPAGGAGAVACQADAPTLPDGAAGSKGFPSAWRLPGAPSFDPGCSPD